MSTPRARHIAIWILGAVGLLAVLGLTGCASTTFYDTAVVKNKDGSESARAVPRLKTSGDIVMPSSVGPDGMKFSTSAASAGMRRTVAVNSKGNPLLDGDKRPIYNEAPVVAGIYHSTATEAAYLGGSFLTRSFGSVFGTAFASIFLPAAGGQLAGAGASAIAP